MVELAELHFELEHYPRLQPAGSEVLVAVLDFEVVHRSGLLALADCFVEVARLDFELGLGLVIAEQHSCGFVVLQ